MRLCDPSADLIRESIDGEVGDFVVFARKERGGQDWYLGAIAGNHARTVEIPMSFLSPDRRYVATIYRDGDNAHWESDPYDYVIEKRPVNNTDSLALRLAAGGGTAIRIQAAN